MIIFPHMLTTQTISETIFPNYIYIYERATYILQIPENQILTTSLRNTTPTSQGQSKTKHVNIAQLNCVQLTSSSTHISFETVRTVT